MIVFDLVCAEGHRFEGWFASAEAFAQQQERGQLRCPHCDSPGVVKRPTAPAIRRPTPQPAQETSETVAARVITQLRRLAADSEEVGTAFAHEARRIHHGEAAPRAIKGRASAEEVGELIEEGIGVLPVPPPPEDLH